VEFGHRETWMLKAFYRSSILQRCAGRGIHAQEVIVARETKPEASKQAGLLLSRPLPNRRPARTKPKSRQKKSSSAEPTLEQMAWPECALPRGKKTGIFRNPTKAGESDVEVVHRPLRVLPKLPGQ